MNKIQKYFLYRQGLIDQYLKGDMTKREYLKMNYNAVVHNDIGPFKYMDTIEKSLYNYQYYNALAKEMKFEITRGGDIDRRRDYESQADYFYSKKDRATLKVLEMLDYRGVEAYFIKVKSKALKGRLFEIVCENCYGMVLHSTNTLILNRLREEGAFSEGTRVSVIDEYVNARY